MKVQYTYPTGQNNVFQILGHLIPCRTIREFIVKNTLNKHIVGTSFMMENQSADQRVIIDNHIVLEPGETFERKVSFPCIYAERVSIIFEVAPNPELVDERRFANGPKLYLETIIPQGIDLKKYGG